MGANAQTTVQKFLSGAVLTAEQQNFSAATGVPVFATTVTRDAAFGGANKVLAEGQTCYLESTNVVQYYDGAAWATVGPAAASAVLQVLSVTKTDSFTTSSASLVDITGLSVAITPSSASNKVLVLASVSGIGQDVSGGGDCGFVVVRNSTPIAVRGTGSGDFSGHLSRRLITGGTAFQLNSALSHLDSPNTTSATTYKLQAKTGGGTLYINREESGAVFAVSTLTVMEISA